MQKLWEVEQNYFLMISAIPSLLLSLSPTYSICQQYQNNINFWIASETSAFATIWFFPFTNPICMIFLFLNGFSFSSFPFNTHKFSFHFPQHFPLISFSFNQRRENQHANLWYVIRFEMETRNFRMKMVKIRGKVFKYSWWKMKISWSLGSRNHQQWKLFGFFICDFILMCH